MRSSWHSNQSAASVRTPPWKGQISPSAGSRKDQTVLWEDRGPASSGGSRAEQTVLWESSGSSGYQQKASSRGSGKQQKGQWKHEGAASSGGSGTCNMQTEAAEVPPKLCSFCQWGATAYCTAQRYNGVQICDACARATLITSDVSL